jgi:hypothetical protein
MQPALRIVTELPLQELWDDTGVVSQHRLRDLSSDDVRELLRRGPIRFVVVEVGSKPRWIPESQCFTFWKTEVQLRLVGPAQRVNLEALPGGHAYFASEWAVGGSSTVVVLQGAH